MKCITSRPIQSFARSSTLKRYFSTPQQPCKAYLGETHATPSPISVTTKDVLDRGRQYLLPVYDRPDFVLSHGKGAWVWDVDGRKFLDFSAGIAVNALGHADEGVLKVLTEQAGKLIHTSNLYHNEWAGKLAELLVTLTLAEGGLGYTAGTMNDSGKFASVKVFFANSGTEANEGALKIGRRLGNLSSDPSRRKTRIACFENSFHGRSMGALSVTSNPKYQDPFKPLIPDVDVGKLNHFEGLESLVRRDTCAVIVEPIQGEGGIHVASEKWLRALRERCNEVGAVLIFDEVQCGLYRTGTLWAHSSLPADCHPDIITSAKPLANGYPIGAILIRDWVANGMLPGSHGTTFGGSPLACAIGHHVLTRLSSPVFRTQMEDVSGYLGERLSKLPKWYPGILEEDIRGRGFIRGLGFKDNAVPGRIVKLARERGVLILTAGGTVRLVPSLTVSKEEVDLAVDVLESCLESLHITV